MEDDPFNKSKNETDSDDDSENDSSSKKKKKSRRFPLFAVSGNKTEAAESEKKSEESAESLWKRMLGQVPAEQTADEKAEVGIEESVESDDSGQLEVLSEQEQMAIVEAYIAVRQAELAGEQTYAIESGDETLVAERAADIALLDRVKHLLERDRKQPIAEPLQQAYEDTARRLAFEPAMAPAETAPNTTESSKKGAYIEEQIFSREQVSPAPVATRITPNLAPAKHFELGQQAETNPTGTALLVGGAVGYLLGHRQGRIKTEKQMKIVEKKLKNEVNAVEQQIVQKEKQIRSLARETYVQKRTILAPEKISPPPQQRNELIGLVTLKAVEKTPTQNAQEPSKISAEKQPKSQSEFMSRAELIELSATISVGATNLKRVYETNLISEQGLRHLVYEHEHGGNVQASLQRELIEKEKTYERDPRLRNRSLMGALAASSSVVRADIDKKPSGDVRATAKNQKNEAAPRKAASKQSPTNNQVAAYASITTLVVIIALLLYLLFTTN